jgi:RNA polymerase sigma factor (sigma-70 family)
MFVGEGMMGVAPLAGPSDGTRYGEGVETTERRLDELEEIDGVDQSDAPDGLAGRLVAGDRAALEQAYQRWSPLVYTIARRALGDHHDAEDVTQQVFVSAWHSRRTLRPADGAVPAWLVGITRHRIADTRTQRYRSVRNTVAVARQVSADDGVHVDDLAERLLLAHELARLGEPRGTIVRLAVVEQRPAHEVATTLDLPLGTVKSHVRRGLLQLRSRLKEG